MITANSENLFHKPTNYVQGYKFEQILIIVYLVGINFSDYIIVDLVGINFSDFQLLVLHFYSKMYD